MSALRFALFSCLAGLLWPTAVLANGRFPSANQLLVDPADSSHLVLRATYGLLSSHDAGRSFAWVCEDAVGNMGDADPALAIFEDGTVAAGFARDLRLSQRDGCGWSSLFVGDAKENFIDATSDPSDPRQALFLSRRLDSTHQVRIVTAGQSGGEPQPLGAALGDDVSPLTLEVAPSRSDRIYVSAIDADLSSVLLRSDDRGETWQRLPITPHEALPAYIAAVDPNDADRLYLRLDGPSEDVLLVSDDAGENFTEAFSISADMLGFALSPDGASLALGGPGAGLFVASAEQLDFAPSPAPLTNLSCLKWTADALLACANEKADGFTLGASTDAGQSFSALFHVSDLKPLECEKDSDVGAVCPQAWPAVAQTLGVTAAASPKSDSSGCSCALPGARPTSWASLAWLSLLCGSVLTARRYKTRRGRAASLPADRCTPRRSESARPSAPSDRR